MRSHGTLAKWNDDRGFGFIAPAQGGDELFVHISAFPRDGQRPRLNELISFEIEQGQNGKPRAVRVMRPGQRSALRPAARANRPRRPFRISSAILVLAALAAIGVYGFSRINSTKPTADVARAVSATQAIAPSSFKCDGRTTCSQMTSCAEAKYFLQHCPDVKMDGNGDGEPCEQQWCN